MAKARGGLAKMYVSFKGVNKSMEEVFGKKPIPVTGMTKTLWSFVKRYKLLKKNNKAKKRK